MGRQEEATAEVIRWATSVPVLAWRLSIIARDGKDYRDGEQELTCTVADLLDPERGALWWCYLRATGADPAHADATWERVGGVRGIHTVDWVRVRQTLLEADMSWMTGQGP